MFVSLSRFDTMTLFDVIEYWKSYKIGYVFLINLKNRYKKAIDRLIQTISRLLKK